MGQGIPQFSNHYDYPEVLKEKVMLQRIGSSQTDATGSETPLRPEAMSIEHSGGSCYAVMTSKCSDDVPRTAGLFFVGVTRAKSRSPSLDTDPVIISVLPCLFNIYPIGG
jgi:hypothetical protein